MQIQPKVEVETQQIQPKVEVETQQIQPHEQVPTSVFFLSDFLLKSNINFFERIFGNILNEIIG
jgi:hypothetical protein